MSETNNYYPEFFEPIPISPKKNLNKYSIKNKFNILVEELPSILGKRKLVEAFGETIYYEKERYGQEIQPDFFKFNTSK